MIVTVCLYPRVRKTLSKPFKVTIVLAALALGLMAENGCEEKKDREFRTNLHR
jgi:hypothetical protein